MPATLAFGSPVVMTAFYNRFYEDHDSLARRMASAINKLPLILIICKERYGYDVSWASGGALNSFLLCVIAVRPILCSKHLIDIIMFYRLVMTSANGKKALFTRLNSTRPTQNDFLATGTIFRTARIYLQRLRRYTLQLHLGKNSVLLLNSIPSADHSFPDNFKVVSKHTAFYRST
jgi:hypothetical protein